MCNPRIERIPQSSIQDEWPEEGLQFVGLCPVCGESGSRVLHDELRDNVFFCAPGEWTLHSCLNCGSAYLDPRPSEATVHLAYLNYYTHAEQESTTATDLRGMRYVRRLLTNGYRNWRFGAKLRPSSTLGVPFILLLPSKKAAIDRECRHLPKFVERGRLLDVGFGSGAFLQLAQSIGWEVAGIDTDSKAVALALARGLNVRQGDLDVFAEEREAFDVITLSHVIEHAHDPTAVLKACHRLLKPGGTLWLETPNIDSFGRSRFRSNWRGLETPRHLVLFNRLSLHSTLKRMGFTKVRDLSPGGPCFSIYSSSWRMTKNRNPYESTPVPLRLKAEIFAVSVLELGLKSRREFVSVAASKT